MGLGSGICAASDKRIALLVSEPVVAWATATGSSAPEEAIGIGSVHILVSTRGAIPSIIVIGVKQGDWVAPVLAALGLRDVVGLRVPLILGAHWPLRAYKIIAGKRMVIQCAMKPRGMPLLGSSG
jgi:hypothetical protein